MANIKFEPNKRIQFVQSKYRHDILKAALPVWSFLKKTRFDQIVKSDAIFVFGSDNLSVADKAVTLYQNGFAGKILFTGGTGGRFDPRTGVSEAELLKMRAIKKGVPEEDILIETDSQNTQENILKGIEVLRESKVPFSRLILVSLPYQSLRQWATFEKYRLDRVAGLERVTVCNCPASYSLGEIRNEKAFKEEVKRLMHEIDPGILQYRALPKPYIIWIDIPKNVMKAYHHLKRLVARQH